MILCLSCFLCLGVVRAFTLTLTKEPKYSPRSAFVSADMLREHDIFLEMTKRYILQRLDMQERPDTSNVTLMSAQMSVLRKLHTGSLLKDDLNAELRTEQGQDSGEQAYQIITFAKSVWMSRTEAKLSFLLPGEGDETSVTELQHAELWVQFKPIPPGPNPSLGPSLGPGPGPGPASGAERDRQKISLKIFLRRRGGESRTLICDSHFAANGSSWHSFPVTAAVRDSLEKREFLVDFELECRGDNGSLAAFDLDGGDRARQTFLASRLRVSPRPGSRLRKRGIECADKLNLCCRREFYMDFQAIGWDDWIVAPKGYHANHCLGTCLPHMAGSPSVASSYHATVTNLYKINNPHPVLALNSCCVPTKRSSLTMLYFDEQRRIIRRDIPDMVIEECGCA